MTTEPIAIKDDDLSPREMALLKLIDSLAKENANLHIQNQMIRYNKRYTNKKFIGVRCLDPSPVVGLEPKYVKPNPKKVTKLGALK